MAYMRLPHYLYCTEEGLSLNGKFISKEVFDIMLYAMMLTHRRDELVERLKHGRSKYLAQLKYQQASAGPEVRSKMIEEFTDWVWKHEDDLLCGLIGSLNPDFEYLMEPDEMSAELERGLDDLRAGNITIEGFRAKFEEDSQQESL